MSEQRIILTNKDKLVVITDNGRLTNDDSITEIKGVFTVSAEDAVRLFGLINKQRVLYRSLNTNGEFPFLFPNYNTIVVGEKKEIQLINLLRKELQLKEGQITNMEERIRGFCALKEKIMEFNKSRHWWERKLMIKE